MDPLRTGLLFPGTAEEAMNYYKAIFPVFEEISISRMPEGGPAPAGTVLAVNFRINNLEFVGINATYDYQYSETVSFIIDCKDQAEVDYYWNALTSDGGEESMCGWLKDKYGLSWQVTPKRMVELLGDPDPGRSSRAIQAMMQMRKLDIAKLEAAANGEG